MRGSALRFSFVVALATPACAPPPSEGPIFRARVDVVEPDAGAPAPDDARPDAPIVDATPAPDMGADAGSPVDAAPTGPNVFVGASAFASAPVTPSARAQMTKSGTNPTRTSCLTCHLPGSAAGALFAGGTIFRDAAGAAAAADVEIRIVDQGTGAVFTAHTDADGNFWLAPQSPPPLGPFEIGVRDATSSMTMPIVQRALDCGGSACHGGAQGPVHLSR